MARDGISVIIPTRNNSRTLPVLLKSLRDQDSAPDEILVIDGASTDGTAEYARAEGAQVLVDETLPDNRVNSRNLGAAHARSSTLMFLDSDMELTRGVIAEARTLVRGGAKAIILPETTSGRGLNGSIRAWERSLVQTRDELCFARILDKALFFSTGGFDPHLAGFEDLDVQATLIEQGIAFHRMESSLIHHEEEIDLRTYLKKRRFYQRSSSSFRAKHKQLAGVLFSPYHRLKLYASGLHEPRDIALFGAASCLRLAELL